MDLTPKPASASATEMTQVVLPNDTNPLGFMLGGTAMHLIDIAGALAANRHTRARVVTVAVDGLQFLHSIKVGDIVILKARVTATFNTSLEVEVDVFSEEMLTGVRRFTTHAYLRLDSTRNGSCWQRRQREPPALEIDPDGVVPQEAVADDATELEAEQHGGRS